MAHEAPAGIRDLHTAMVGILQQLQGQQEQLAQQRAAQADLVVHLQNLAAAIPPAQAAAPPAAPPVVDGRGRTQKDQWRDYVDFQRQRPMFERGKMRWADFAKMFQVVVDDYGVNDERAKKSLYLSITGQSSRLVIASMEPTRADMAGLTFRQYMDRMGQKFTPAAESLQMEAEYRSRRQGKKEDVQNYINAKHELFQYAFPDARPEPWRSSTVKRPRGS